MSRVNFFLVLKLPRGIANGWSLYGGALGDENYQSAALGVGRDLSTFGAVAFDVTHSHTKLDKDTAYGKGSLDGNSFRVSYSKDFDQLNSRVTFCWISLLGRELYDHERVSGCQ